MSIPVSIDPMGTLGASPLPPGYRLVTALVSDGNQYIDTGYVMKTSSRWEYDWQALSSAWGGNGAFHWQVSYTTVDCGYGTGRTTFTTGKNAIAVDTGVDARERSLVFLDLPAQQVGASWAGRPPFVQDADLYAGRIPITLLARNKADASVPGERVKAKIFRCRFFEDGELVMDLVPVLDANGEACMYDLAGAGDAESRTYRNLGTGTFSYER